MWPAHLEVFMMNAKEEFFKKQLLKGKEIVFVNEPFMAVVEKEGEQPIKCYPVVYDVPFNCGVGVFYEIGDGSRWGMMSPRDLITAWRATEILQHITHIKNGTLCSAYYAGQRNVHISNQHRVDEIISIIGKEKYYQIMAMPVPEEIIQAIIDRQKADIPPNVDSITDELRVGTVQWRPEFVDLEVERPEEVDRRNEMFKNTIARYEKLLSSYAKYVSLPRKCNGMYNVESALVTLIEKKMDQSYLDDVVVALAGVVGHLFCYEERSILMPFCQSSSQKEYNDRFESEKISAICKSAAWIIKLRSPWIFFRQKKDSLTEETARNLLEELFVEFFPPPKSFIAKGEETKSSV